MRNGLYALMVGILAAGLFGGCIAQEDEATDLVSIIDAYEEGALTHQESREAYQSLVISIAANEDAQAQEEMWSSEMKGLSDQGVPVLELQQLRDLDDARAYYDARQRQDVKFATEGVCEDNLVEDMDDCDWYWDDWYETVQRGACRVAAFTFYGLCRGADSILKT